MACSMLHLKALDRADDIVSGDVVRGRFLSAAVKDVNVVRLADRSWPVGDAGCIDVVVRWW